MQDLEYRLDILAEEINYIMNTTKAKSNVVEDIMKWGREKGINNPTKQLNKLAEETLEARDALTLYTYYKDSESHLVEEIGDIGVVWILLCQMLDIKPEDALKVAHNKNKDRTGKTINGSFVKEEDL